MNSFIKASQVRAVFDNLVFVAQRFGVPNADRWVLVADDSGGGTAFYRLKEQGPDGALSGVFENQGFLGASASAAYVALSYLRKGVELVPLNAIVEAARLRILVELDTRFQDLRDASKAWEVALNGPTGDEELAAAEALNAAVGSLDDWLSSQKNA